MATTTTNFGWDIPQSTDLVKDGATAIAALGQDIDTALVDLKGGTTGQVLAKASGTDLDFSWVAQDDSNAIQNAIVDAKGDLIGATAADTPARLAVGTNGQVLTADSTAATGLKWANAGKVLQVVQGTYATDTTTTSTSFGDTGLTQAITPLLNTSQVLVMITIPYFSFASSVTSVGGKFKILRGATELGNYSAANTVFMAAPSGSLEIDGTWAITFLDSPATTSATTYKVQFASKTAGTTLGVSPSTVTSTITLMEIGA
jgi:hypothetical protein